MKLTVVMANATVLTLDSDYRCHRCGTSLCMNTEAHSILLQAKSKLRPGEEFKVRARCSLCHDAISETDSPQYTAA